MLKRLCILVLLCYGVTSLFGQNRLVQNPILPGFNPDPDIIRVGEDYYIATTTFEWSPGVNIYHSRDLENWTLVDRPLGKDHIDLRGVPNSGGNYIPSLLFNRHDSLFYLVYSNVLDRHWPMMSMRSYVTTAKEIGGEWSSPVYLNSVGFDPAFFIDEDGKTYLINMVLDYQGWPQMIGLMIQEYDTKNKELVGEPRMIMDLRGGDPSLFTTYPEGPHIYRKDGYYYLLFAAGGTYWTHQSWLARSKSIFGPYEMAPNNPILTSMGSEAGSMQKAGQGSLVETQYGDWYIAHHVARPILTDSVSPLGRETCLQNVTWTSEGWLELTSGGKFPQNSFTVKGIDLNPQFQKRSTSYEFDSKDVPKAFQSLREPMDSSWITLDKNEGSLSIRGRQGITSLLGQSLLAQRWTSLDFEVRTSIDFDPSHFLQQAGLVLFYDTEDFQYAYLTYDEKKGRVIRMMQWTGSKGFNKMPNVEIEVPSTGDIFFKVEVSKGHSQFYYSLDNEAWGAVGPKMSINHLSDEGVDGDKNGFTGSFVGLAVQDRMQESLWAHFDYFYYQNR